MSAIRNALANLDEVVERLEDSVEQLEQSLAGQQRDMFAAPPSNQNATARANGNGAVNGHALAQHLDQAIEKVERILREG